MFERFCDEYDINELQQDRLQNCNLFDKKEFGDKVR